jgi:hypothetical protein
MRMAPRHTLHRIAKDRRQLILIGDIDILVDVALLDTAYRREASVLFCKREALGGSAIPSNGDPGRLN